MAEKKVLTVEVTPEHIREGECQSVSNCPVAVAVRQVLPDVRDIGVHGSYITLNGETWFDDTGTLENFVDAIDLHGDDSKEFQAIANGITLTLERGDAVWDAAHRSAG